MAAVLTEARHFKKTRFIVVGKFSAEHNVVGVTARADQITATVSQLITKHVRAASD